ARWAVACMAWVAAFLHALRDGAVRVYKQGGQGGALKILSSLGCRIFLRGRVGAVGWVVVGEMWVGWVSKGWMG
ncbi:hypothetical protein IWX47DRAFT_871700, partial [Phyllosticta citricarpa]